MEDNLGFFCKIMKTWRSNLEKLLESLGSLNQGKRREYSAKRENNLITHNLHLKCENKILKKGKTDAKS